MTKTIDSYGFDLNTSNPAAAAACDQGVRSFVAWLADAMGHLDEAIASDNGFALPRIVKAWILHAARTARFAPVVQALLTEVEPLLADASDRERTLTRAVRLAIAGNLQAAVAALETHLAEHPTDVLAHRLAQFELFWSGESAWMRDIAERAAPAWGDDTPDLAHFHAVRAFSNEEAGDYETAERVGRASVERDPESAWGAHAVAHTLVMLGRAQEGTDFLERMSAHWGRVNQVAHHNWWHLCLFLVELGEYDRVLDLLETRVRNPDSPLVRAMPDATIDIQNVSSLLKRLELRGVDVRGRWTTIAEICANRLSDHANPFTSAHDAMALAATGRFDLIDRLVESMEEDAPNHGTLGAVTGIMGVPLVRAMAAHQKGNYGRVVDLLWPIRRDLHQVGGSHAQRDIFFQILADAAMRDGRLTQLRILLDDIAGIGFRNVDERSLYRDAAALVA